MKVIRRLSLIVLAIATAILVPLMCFSYFSSFLSPERLGMAAIIWFGFPYLWFLCGVLCVAWLVVRPRWAALVPLVAMLFTFSGMLTIVDFGNAPVVDGHELKILTYNARLFNNKPESRQGIVDFIRGQDADIVCLQEMCTEKFLTRAGFETLDKLFPQYPYVLANNHVTELGPKERNGDGMIIFSRLPLQEYRPMELEGPFSQRFIGAIVTIDSMRHFAVFNVHLESIKLMPRHLDAVNNVTHAYEHETGSNLFDTFRHLRSAFDERADQVRKLVECDRVTDMPVIVCGDFNDTPISYTYNKLSTILIDSFREAHGGFGDTYNGPLPPLRIDYVFHSHAFCCTRYEELDIDFSDHLPVACTLVIE